MPNSFELELFKKTEANSGVVPTVEVDGFIASTVGDPRNSVVASMGSSNIKTNHDGLLDRVTTWRASSEYYKEKSESLSVKEDLYHTLYKRFESQYAALYRSLKQADTQYKSTRNMREKADVAHRVYEQRADLGDLLLEILDKMKNRTFTPLANLSSEDNDGDDDMTGGPAGDNVTIEQIRTNLKLETLAAVIMLGITDLLAVLRI